MAWGNTNVFFDNEGGNGNSLFRKNIVVNADDFIEYNPLTGTEEKKLYDLGYIYRADVEIEECLELMIPDITLSLADLQNANADFANLVGCHNGGIYLYATNIPANDITILNLELSWNSSATEIDKILTPGDIGAPTIEEMNAAIANAIGAALEASY